MDLMNILALGLGAIMILLSFVVIFAKKMMHAVIIFGGVSLLSSLLFLLMHAPDVALTEASIGAGLTMAIFVLAIKRIEEVKDGKE